MSRCPTMNFELSIKSKWLAKHVSTKVSLKINIRKRHVYIDIGCTWIWNQCFYLGIWNDDLMKKIVLPSFQLATRFKSQNPDETVFINELWPINIDEYSYLQLALLKFRPHVNVFFWLHFNSLHDYWPPRTCNPLVHTSWSELERCENVLFSSSKCEIKSAGT